jgi:putative membrane protein
MDHFLLKLIVNALAVFITAYLLKGVSVKNFFTAIITALLIGLVNAFLKPVFVFLTIPLTIVTLGLFLLVIDALLILLVDKMLSGFKVKSFGWAILFSIVVSIVNTVLVWLL